MEEPANKNNKREREIGGCEETNKKQK